MEGHIADMLKTCGPKLTQINLEVTINDVGDRVMLPEKCMKSDPQKKGDHLSRYHKFCFSRSN